MRSIFIVGIFYIGIVFGLLGEEPKETSARLKEIQDLISTLKYESGNISLPHDLAIIHLEEGFQYLNPDDTEKVLVKIWGNPAHGHKSLGMLVPKDFDPLSKSAWVVVVQYTEEGYVSEEDAQKINYNDLLKQMKESVAEASKQREKEGYSSLELIGWATPPRYDAKEHKLYWAKELRFGQEKETTLNYNIRILGRKGVLELNVVSGIQQLKEVEDAGPKILSMVSFNPGSRYADFNSSTDKMATYGIAALVAGGVAAKAGLFKGLWIGLLAFKKFIFVGVVAASTWIKKLFTKKRPPGLENNE
ncbi:MAG: DUF2167 domain-containing protein [Verrucomicrobiota bacterium]